MLSAVTDIFSLADRRFMIPMAMEDLELPEKQIKITSNFIRYSFASGRFLLNMFYY